MPSTLRSTYFVILTEVDLQALQRGESVEKMAVRDEFIDGNVEEYWVEITPPEIPQKFSNRPLPPGP